MSGAAAAFLDRDGVINLDRGFVYRPEDLDLTPTAARGIRLLNDAGHRVLVVTNQSGVARGMFGMDDVDRFHAAIRDRLAAQGAHIDQFYVCPYHPDGIVAAYAREHPDRKPAPGMIERAIADWGICRTRSFLIGDKPRDVEAAQRAGVPGILVPSDTCDLAAEVRKRLGNGAWH